MKLLKLENIKIFDKCCILFVRSTFIMVTSVAVRMLLSSALISECILKAIETYIDSPKRDKLMAKYLFCHVVVVVVFLTGLVITCFVTNTNLQHEQKLEIIRYLRSIQCLDGGWGL